MRSLQLTILLVVAFLFTSANLQPCEPTNAADKIQIGISSFNIRGIDNPSS